MVLLVIGLISANILVFVGLYGILFRRDNLIITMVCIEISLLGVALMFALTSVLFGDLTGTIVFLMLLTLAGVESALGLAFVICYYRLRTSIRWSTIAALRG